MSLSFRNYYRHEPYPSPTYSTMDRRTPDKMSLPSITTLIEDVDKQARNSKFSSLRLRRDGTNNTQHHRGHQRRSTLGGHRAALNYPLVLTGCRMQALQEHKCHPPHLCQARSASIFLLEFPRVTIHLRPPGTHRLDTSMLVLLAQHQNCMHTVDPPIHLSQIPHHNGLVQTAISRNGDLQMRRPRSVPELVLDLLIPT